MTDSHRLKLLIVTSSFPRDPQDETCGYIRDFARELSGTFETVVLAPPDPGAPPWTGNAFKLERSPSILPTAFERFRASSDLNTVLSGGAVSRPLLLVSLLLFFWTAWRLAKRADLVCSHWLVPSGLVGAVISRFSQKPHVAIEHSGALHLLMRVRGGRRLLQFIVNGSKQVITVTNDLRVKLIRLCPDSADKVQALSMGTRLLTATREGQSTGFEASGPTRQFNPVDSDGDGGFIALFVGRLESIKGADVLLRAVSKVEGIRVLIAGGGAEKGRLEELASRLNVDAIFLGTITAAQRERLLANCQILVVPSLRLESGRTEGLPVVCLEAMAAGLPVLGSRVGGLPELIVDLHNGMLFEPGDDETLSLRLRALMDDPARRRMIGSNARTTAAAYDWRLISKRFADILTGVVEEGDC